MRAPYAEKENVMLFHKRRPPIAAYDADEAKIRPEG